MTTTEIAKAIRNDLILYVDQSRRESIAISHPTSMKVFGLKVADLRKVIDKWRKILSPFSEAQWIALSIELVDNDILECQLIAYEFLWKNKKALQAMSVEHILTLGKNLDNWASVDVYCLCITGYSWRTGNLQDKTIEHWAMSENRWVRRKALVSTVPLNLRARGGTGDAKRTLRICSLLVSDKDDMVVKAMSWALRELSKSDLQAVIQFMEVYKDTLHSRVKREVETKLRTGKKKDDNKHINSVTFVPAN